MLPIPFCFQLPAVSSPAKLLRMPAGTAGNRVDCGLGCLIEKHWHGILVYGLIGIAGLLILHAARATCREHLVKRRIVRALLGPKERRVVPTADDPTGN